MFAILLSGQTGVERGAYRAALAAKLPIAGVAPHPGRDESGPLPADIAALLAPSPASTPSPDHASAATLARASVLVLVVPEAARWSEWPALPIVHREARARALDIEIVDETTDLAEVHARLERRAALEVVRLYVTGPTETQWAGGAQLGFRFVTGLVPTDELWIGAAPRSAEF